MTFVSMTGFHARATRQSSCLLKHWRSGYVPQRISSGLTSPPKSTTPENSGESIRPFYIVVMSDWAVLRIKALGNFPWKLMAQNSYPTNN